MTASNARDLLTEWAGQESSIDRLAERIEAYAAAKVEAALSLRATLDELRTSVDSKEGWVDGEVFPEGATTGRGYAGMRWGWPESEETRWMWSELQDPTVWRAAAQNTDEQAPSQLGASRIALFDTKPSIAVRILGWLLRRIIWEAMRQHPDIDGNQRIDDPLLTFWDAALGRHRHLGRGA